MTPRSRKPGYGLLLGCRSSLDAGPFEKTFFDDVRKMNWPKTGKIFTVRFGPASQSIGRGRLSREGALDVRESRERRDEIVPIFSPENRKTQFWPEIFHFFEQGRLLCARVDIGVTESQTETAEKEEEKNLGLRFVFSKVGVRIPFSMGNFHFLAAKNLTFGGEYNFKTG